MGEKLKWPARGDFYITSGMVIPPSRCILFLAFWCMAAGTARAFQAVDTGVSTSTPEEALRLIGEVRKLDSSAHWPQVRPSLFLENLKLNIQSPLALYQGSNTNFCGYAALSYLPLHEDPLGYARFMLALYRDGRADWGKISFDPSPEVKQAAGTLRFKG